MIGMTKDEFKEIAAVLATFYPEKKAYFTDKDVLEIWLRLLSGTDTRIIQSAVDNYMAKNREPPTIADLREEYNRIAIRQKEISRELRTIYDRTVGTYPNSLDNKETQAAWWELIKGYPLEERIAAAEEVERMTIDYIREVERSDRQEVPHITDFFKGAR